MSGSRAGVLNGSMLAIGSKGQVVEGVVSKVSNQISINFNGVEVAVPKTAVQNAREGETRRFKIMDVSKDNIVLKEVGNGGLASGAVAVSHTTVSSGVNSGTYGYRTGTSGSSGSKDAAAAKTEMNKNLAVLTGDDYKCVEESEGSVDKCEEEYVDKAVEIKENVDVFQSILVVDAMTGQDAVNVAKEFNEKVGVDGIIITKMDGDTRGGAALSIRSVTGKPILYVGMGEKLEDLQQFYPDRMTSRILGMGDVLSLIEKAEQTINEEDALRMTEKMKKAEFDFNDFLDQMDQMKKMGGLSNLLSMIPGVGNKMQGLDIDDSMMDKTAAIIYSMTKEERANPKIINASRKRRIAAGAGVPIAEVNRLCKQVQNQKQMMKQMSGMFGGKGGKRGGFKLPF